MDTLTQLEESFGDNHDLFLFYVSWLKNGLNATKAYLELHPKVTDDSARVMAHRFMSRIDKQLILAAYSLDIDAYMQQLKEGLHAMRPIPADILVNENGEVIRTDRRGIIEVPDHLTRRYYHDKLGRLLQYEGKIEINQYNQNNYFDLKDEQISTVIDKTGSMGLGETELVEALIEGNLPSEEQDTSVELHQEELPSADSPL